MARSWFSVPDHVEQEFDRVFGGQNKNTIIVELMRTAVTDVRSQA